MRRAKYPNLVVGSVAPSGPVYASLNFTQYYGVFSTAACTSSFFLFILLHSFPCPPLG
jgi:hypothetical protein